MNEVAQFHIYNQWKSKYVILFIGEILLACLPPTKEVRSNGNWNFHHSSDVGSPASRVDRRRSSRHLQQERLCDPNPLNSRDPGGEPAAFRRGDRSEEHTSELQSLMRISYAVYCLKINKDKGHAPP